MIEPAHLSTTAQPHTPQRDTKLWEMSQSLEASFLSEMLQVAGFGKSREAFGGGVGEDQFSSLLVSERAELIVKAGGIGLAESIYNSLLTNSSGDS